MGTEVGRTPYDCNTSRRNQYDFIYSGNLSTGRLGKSLSECLLRFRVTQCQNIKNIILNFKNFIRLENEHVGRTRERFKNSHRSVKKLPQLMTEKANFIEHNYK